MEIMYRLTPELEVPLGHIYVSPASIPYVERDGRTKIYELFGSEAPTLFDITLERPDPWLWDWEVPKETCPLLYGSFSARLRKRIAKLERPKEIRDYLQTLVPKACEIARGWLDGPVGSYYFEFTTDLGWRAGNFGDGRSCFWTSHRSARDTLAENGVAAIRLYRTNAPASERKPAKAVGPNGEELFGYARAWVIPGRLENVKVDLPECFWITNAYGIGSGTIADILVKTFNLAGYVGAHISNFGYDEIYLNGDGMCLSTTIHDEPLSGEDEDSLSDKDTDLYLDMEPTGFECEACGEWCYLHEESDCGGMCDNCYSNSIVCDHCGERITEGDAAYAVEGNLWCESCVDCSAYRCDECEEYFREGHVTDVDGSFYCNSCLDRVAGVCDNCGEYRFYEDLHADDDGNGYCDQCVGGITRCADCSRPTIYTEEVGGEEYCSGCAEKAKEELEEVE